jgi:hypothetical protein
MYVWRAYLGDLFDGIKLGFYPLLIYIIYKYAYIHTYRAYLSDFFDGIKLGFYPLFERAALQILIAGLGRV